ncbi:MAG: hypothetical protein JWO42_972 [Chloroflexi bacterium]|nr:hypothetical protein [Chloroflexota bacterium]
MSRKGELWRGDLAQHIEDYLNGAESAESLIDWAMDHPFFEEDRQDLSDEEQRAIAHALGTVLQLDPSEPEATRSTDAHLRETIEILWNRKAIADNGV